jgi:hypothetical protein
MVISFINNCSFLQSSEEFISSETRLPVVIGICALGIITFLGARLCKSRCQNSHADEIRDQRNRWLADYIQRSQPSLEPLSSTQEQYLHLATKPDGLSEMMVIATNNPTEITVFHQRLAYLKAVQANNVEVALSMQSDYFLDQLLYMADRLHDESLLIDVYQKHDDEAMNRTALEIAVMNNWEKAARVILANNDSAFSFRILTPDFRRYLLSLTRNFEIRSMLQSA